MTTASNGESLVIQGRLVWTTGKSIFEGQGKTDYGTNNPTFDKQGNPVVEYGFGLAIAKVGPDGQQSPEYLKTWTALHQQAYTLYPDGNIPPAFAMKFKDGDGIDHKGVPFSQREGYAGHLILTCLTRIPIKYFRHDGVNNIQVNDGIKAGDYVNVQLNVKAHPAVGAGNAGLYLNPSCVQFIQAGKEIVNAPSGDQLFGQVAPTFAGQVEAPVTPVMPQVAQMAPAPQAAPVTPAIPAQQAAPAPAHYGVLPQTLQPAAPVAPAMPVVPGNAPVGVAAPAPAPMQAAPQPATPAYHGNAAPPMPQMP